MEINKGSLVTNNQFYNKGKVFFVLGIDLNDKITVVLLNDEQIHCTEFEIKDCELFKGRITLENKILVEESLILSAKVIPAKKLRKTKDFM